MLGSLSGNEILLIGTIGALGVVGTAFWAWMLIDCARRQDLSDGGKVVWVLIILLAQVFGATIYFFFGRQRHEAAAT